MVSPDYSIGLALCLYFSQLRLCLLERIIVQSSISFLGHWDWVMSIKFCIIAQV